MDFVDKLNECPDFACIFNLVKSAVETTIGKKRVGLILGLSDLPYYVGAFHQMGSNFIIMNKQLLKEITRSGNRELINAYIFHILLHEYIHSLGYVDEEKTQLLSYLISEKVLGSDHPATLISKYGIGYVLSKVGRFEHKPRIVIEIVEDIESDNLDYFG